MYYEAITNEFSIFDIIHAALNIKYTALLPLIFIRQIK